VKNDPSGVVGVIATNLVAIGIAWWQHWPLVTLLWPYWLQSVIIGWYSRKRILALRDFSLQNTSGFDGGSPEATKRQTARFFTLHYGIFHLVYALFLWTLTRGGMRGVPAYHVSALDLAFMAMLTVSFVITIAPPTRASWPPTSRDVRISAASCSCPTCASCRCISPSSSASAPATTAACCSSPR